MADAPTYLACRIRTASRAAKRPRIRSASALRLAAREYRHQQGPSEWWCSLCSFDRLLSPLPCSTCHAPIASTASSTEARRGAKVALGDFDHPRHTPSFYRLPRSHSTSRVLPWLLLIAQCFASRATMCTTNASSSGNNAVAVARAKEIEGWILIS